ncbi:MBL fold metallo-hydrolase [Roseateles sp.]|jgi:glyoxylase-like metal-dependent hydrolase (beta-lactamase superfamily II)|uniref:MBL fold metallo-hydrolase n=1 Tax=Roseateles sp. TaxID=1971397 RepID=UPI0037C60A8C
MPDFLQALGDGIYAIDTGFQRDRFDAAYLITEAGRAAFIDTGTNHSVPRLLTSLDALGIAREAVDWVIPTHVHLDHAGGVGLLVQSLPTARVLAHPRGLRHLVSPTALWAGALAVYGEEEMQRSYGRLVPVPAARAEPSHDGQVIELAGRPLLLIDTPGHARHHHCIWDERSGGWFTGDTFGIAYPEFTRASDGAPWLFPTSTPVQFEPDELRASVTRLLEKSPRAMYLTHYSRVGRSTDEVRALADYLLKLVDAMVHAAQAVKDLAGAERHTALKARLLLLYQQEACAHQPALTPEAAAELLGSDVELNAQGLEIWLDKLLQAQQQ